MHRTRGIVLLVFLVPLWLFPGVRGFADDAGIDTARLIEEEPGFYLLELDTSARLATAYHRPILPSRFQHVGRPERERQAGCLTVRYRFRSSGQPLGIEDEILLPWNRAGVSLTAQWCGGPIYQALFLRDVQCIYVPIRQLQSVRKSTWEVVVRNFRDGVHHCAGSWFHWFFVLGICLIAKGRKLLRMILLLAAGHGLSLVAADIGSLNLPLPVVDWCFALAAILAARTAWLGVENSARFFPILLVLGTLHGLAYANLLVASGQATTQISPALFAFNMGVDLVHVVAAGAIGTVVYLLGRVNWFDWDGSFVQLSVGSVATALILVAVFGVTPPASLPDARHDRQAQFKLPGQAATTVQGTKPQSRSPRQMTDPVMSFVTVEPFEVRHEILVSAAVAKDWLSSARPLGSIEIGDQEIWKRQVERKLLESARIQIDGQDVAPNATRVNFVSIGANGIYERQIPIRETTSKAVLGSEFVYETIDLPRRVSVQWESLPENVTEIPSITSDPFSRRLHSVTGDRRSVHWERRLTGYSIPEVKQVAVAKTALPVLSLCLATLAFVAYRWLARSGRPRLAHCAAMFTLALAIATYPFIRTSLQLPAPLAFKPSVKEAASILDDLLTNVYCSFDIRDENAIYDRLALSVTGDQLRNIYLENRRSLELGNRGGARAKVDQVEILEVQDVRARQKGAVTIDATWMVSGGVTHYGHAHCRQNRYDAQVDIAPVDGAWKIQDIEIVEQRREL